MTSTRVPPSTARLMMSLPPSWSAYRAESASPMPSPGDGLVRARSPWTNGCETLPDDPGIDAGAVVLDPDVQVPVPGRGLQPGDGVRVGVADDVVQEFGHDPLDLLPIDHDPLDWGPHVQALASWPCCGHGLRQQLRHVDPLVGLGDVDRVAVQVQQVHHEAFEARRVRHQPLRELLDLRRWQGRVACLERLGIATDAGQRRPQLMGDAIEERRADALDLGEVLGGAALDLLRCREPAGPSAQDPPQQQAGPCDEDQTGQCEVDQRAGVQ